MNTRKLLCVTIVVCIILSLVSTVPAVASSYPATPNHLTLVQKPHSGDTPPDWQSWSFAMWGQLTYYTPWPTFDFAFDGHGLAASTAYTLIYYPDPWPANGLICLASGASNNSGDIELHKQPGDNIGPLPISTDQNANLATTTYPGSTGAKIWLVLSSDVDCSGHKMTAQRPAQYLLELWLIRYDTTTSATTTVTTVSLTTVTAASQTITQTLTTTESTTEAVTVTASTSTTTVTTTAESNVGLWYVFIAIAFGVGATIGGLVVALSKRRLPPFTQPPFTQAVTSFQLKDRGDST